MNTENQKNQPENPSDLSNTEVKIQQVIRWRVEDPYKFLNMGGKTQVENTIIAYSESITREIASKLKFDALVGLKTKVGQSVLNCLQKKKDEASGTENKTKTIKESTYVYSSAIFIVLLAISPFIFFHDMSVVTSICVLLIALGFGVAGVRKIEIQHRGVMTILGKRTQRNVSEGYQWVPWPLMDFIQVDMREQLIELKTEDRMIKVIAGNANHAGDAMPVNFSAEIDSNFRDESGVDVVSVLCSEILPANMEIIRSREALAIEMAKSKAQNEDMKSQGERAKLLMTNLPGLSSTEALRAVQAQEGDLVRDEMIVTGADGAQQFFGLFASTVKRLGIDKEGDNRNNRRNDRRNKNRNQPNPNQNKKGGTP